MFNDMRFVFILFLAISTVALFTFLSVATWVGTRQQERESYYKAEMIKKIAEAGGERNPAFEYLREQERIAAAKREGGFRLGGLICVGVGIALMILLHTMVPVHGVYLTGLIPLFVGIALLVYGFWMMPQTAAARD
jgi:NADH:ubiquinone oxidoreductase subunit 3 (subunit A)